MEKFVASRLFALLMGIDKYASSDIRPLRGAVADARKVQSYLLQLGVPGDNIKILLDESATRSAILGEFRRLSDDPSIRPGDPIFIFYAGYGSETASPSSWKAAGIDDKVQLLMPYDVCWKRGERAVAPIPDRTLNALLDAIAERKGNNIVVMTDSCYSASGTISIGSSELVRSVPLPADFRLQESLDLDIRSRTATYCGPQSHVLLSACGSSGQAWECNGRGDFTKAFLQYLTASPTNDLRYREIIMRMDINPRQSPQCHGCNRDRYIFTKTSAPLIEYYTPAYTRTAKDGAFEYFLNGGTAHGLAAGDEFDIYSDMNSPKPEGRLGIHEVGSFYSIARPTTGGHMGIPLAGTAFAIRVKRQPLRLYSRPGDRASEMLPFLSCGARLFSGFIVVDTPDESNIDISIQDNHTIFRLRNTRSTQLLNFERTVEELARLFEGLWHFSSQLERTSDFPDITQNVGVEIYELQKCLPGASPAGLSSFKAVPYKSNSVTLRQGFCYAIKLTNDSSYDLYPTVLYLDSSNEFQIDTLYQPVSTRSNLNAPLRKSGGSLIIGYGSGGSPLVIPPSDREGLRCLKISVFSRPQDPCYDTRSFRLANPLPENVKGPWATIKLDIHLHHLQTCVPLGRQGVLVSISPIAQSTLHAKGRNTTALGQDEEKPGFKPSQQHPIQVSQPIFLQGEKHKLIFQPAHGSPTKVPPGRKYGGSKIQISNPKLYYPMPGKKVLDFCASLFLGAAQ